MANCYEKLENDCIIFNCAQFNDDKKTEEKIDLIGNNILNSDDNHTQDLSKQFIMKSLRISCRSDKYIPQTDYIGILLYLYKDDNNSNSNSWQSNWKLNYIHCQTGYIIIKKSKSLEAIKDEPIESNPDLCKTWHAALYQLIFKQLPNENILASGFAIQKKRKPRNSNRLKNNSINSSNGGNKNNGNKNNKNNNNNNGNNVVQKKKGEIDGFDVDYDNYRLYFNSRTFNKATSWKNRNDTDSDNFHDNKKYCHKLEQKWIAVAVNRWKNGIESKQDGIIQITHENDLCHNCVNKILQAHF